jgi:multicomponent K+:H+ antiporter subunit A
LTRGDQVRASPLYVPALLLILAGSFHQVGAVPIPFLAAPRHGGAHPVSAYLHSATMVKAGIFLLARLWPVLSGTDLWFIIVTTAGLATMLVGAWIALFKDDLKAILAYSTSAILASSRCCLVSARRWLLL